MRILNAVQRRANNNSLVASFACTLEAKKQPVMRAVTPAYFSVCGGLKQDIFSN